MIITFCGHSDFQITEEYERKVFEFFERKIGDSFVDVYLGGYGGFDSFAYECCKKYKEKHPNMSLIFVTPYLDVKYKQMGYDSVIYPGLENKPLRFAVIYRNRYMVEKADYIIAFVSRSFGGAYKTYKYAKSKKKPIYNLVEFKD